MTDLIIAMAIAVFLTTGLIAGAFSYGLRCGKAMQGDIPKDVLKKCRWATRMTEEDNHGHV
jgi:hypothetical protein